jgi:hypothetical protein
MSRTPGAFRTVLVPRDVLAIHRQGARELSSLLVAVHSAARLSSRKGIARKIKIL